MSEWSETKASARLILTQRLALFCGVCTVINLGLLIFYIVRLWWF